MKKLQLDVEKLAVESFEPLATAEAEGTVQGHAASYWQSQCKSYCTFERCCTAETFNGTC
jgi:hypothetical protein